MSGTGTGSGSGWEGREKEGGLVMNEWKPSGPCSTRHLYNTSYKPDPRMSCIYSYKKYNLENLLANVQVKVMIGGCEKYGISYIHLPSDSDESGTYHSGNPCPFLYVYDISVIHRCASFISIICEIKLECNSTGLWLHLKGYIIIQSNLNNKFK